MIGRVLRTLVYLEPAQLAGQVLARVYRASPRNIPAPPMRTRTRPWTAGVPKSGFLAGPHIFTSLNKTYDVSSAGDWDCPDRLFLWKYNLHYFDYLNADRGAEHRAWARALVGRWINEHPRGIGWEPYPTSLRLCNWIRHHWEAEPLSAEAIASLARQADLLSRSVEHHIGANHVLANAKALVFAGEFFDGPVAEQWRECGLRILSRELPRQFLADGGHYERSPMYHAILLEDLLDLVNVLATQDCRQSKEFCCRLIDTIAAAQVWLRRMTLADGSFPLFGDSSRGIAPSLSDLFDYARRLGIAEEMCVEGNAYLPHTGFLRLQPSSNVTLFATVAGPKPNHQPGHSHADTFAFEVYVDGRAILVDAGVPTYERGLERLRSRGTALHNTLQIGSTDSSEVWSSFRVGRRARILAAQWTGGAGATFTATHDGYRALAGRPLHTRNWKVEPNVIRIDDTITCNRPQQVTIRFRAGPGLQWIRRTPVSWLLVDAELTVVKLNGDPRLDYRVVQAPYYPEFNAPSTVEVLEAIGTLNSGAVCSHSVEFPVEKITGALCSGTTEQT